MEKTSAIQEIRERTNQIAANVTAMHPLVPKLADAPGAGGAAESIVRTDKQVELVIKKHLLKVEIGVTSKSV